MTHARDAHVREAGYELTVLGEKTRHRTRVWRARRRWADRAAGGSCSIRGTYTATLVVQENLAVGRRVARHLGRCQLAVRTLPSRVESEGPRIAALHLFCVRRGIRLARAGGTDSRFGTVQRGRAPALERIVSVRCRAVLRAEHAAVGARLRLPGTADGERREREEKASSGTPRSVMIHRRDEDRPKTDAAPRTTKWRDRAVASSGREGERGAGD